MISRMDYSYDFGCTIAHGWLVRAHDLDHIWEFHSTWRLLNYDPNSRLSVKFSPIGNPRVEN